MTDDLSSVSRHDPDTIFAVFELDSFGGSSLADMNGSFSAVTGCEKQHIGKYTAELFSAEHTLRLHRTASACMNTGKSITCCIPDSSISCRLWKVTAHTDDGNLYMHGSAVYSAENAVLPACLPANGEYAGSVSAVHTAAGFSAEHINGISAGYAETLLRSEAAELCMMNGAPAEIYDIMGTELVQLSFLPADDRSHIAVTVRKILSPAAEDISGRTAFCTARSENGKLRIDEADAKFTVLLGRGLISENELLSLLPAERPRGTINDRGVSVCVIPFMDGDRALIAAAGSRYTIGRCMTCGEYLTKSEYTVMMLAAGGVTDKGIAFSMKTGESSVKKMIHRCCTKLGAANRVEMSARAGIAGDGYLITSAII